MSMYQLPDTRSPRSSKRKHTHQDSCRMQKQDTTCYSCKELLGLCANHFSSTCNCTTMPKGLVFSPGCAGSHEYLSMRWQGSVQGQNLAAPLASLPDAGGGLQLAHQASDLRGARHEDEYSLALLTCRHHVRCIWPVLQHACIRYGLLRTGGVCKQKTGLQSLCCPSVCCRHWHCHC